MNQTVPPPPPTSSGPAGGSYGASAAAKNGLPIWAWIGIGCGCLVILAILVVVALGVWGGKKLKDFAEEVEKNPAAIAEMVVKLNPDLELVETDREAGTLTIRDKKTGKVGTFDFSDIENGNFSFEGSDGSTFTTSGSEGKMEVTDADGNTSTYSAGADVGNLPGWLHLYPDADVNVGFSQKGGGTATGVLYQSTGDSVAEVADHFEKLFESEGWEVTRTTTTTIYTVIVVSARSEDGTYTQAATAQEDEAGVTQISLQYQGPEE